MYCIECGAQIPDNSKFCSHCGKPQNEAEPTVNEIIAGKIIETEIVRQIVEEHKKSLDYQFLRKSMGWYLAWVLLHLAFLLIGADSILSDGYNDEFVPFSKDSDMDEYDIREFFVYTIFPLAILIIISLVRNENSKNIK